MVDKQPKLFLPFILYQFIDERQYQMICVKVYLLSSAKSETIKTTISPCGMTLCIDCRYYQSNFIDAERHVESFQAPLEGLSFRKRMLGWLHLRMHHRNLLGLMAGSGVIEAGRILLSHPACGRGARESETCRAVAWYPLSSFKIQQQ